MDEPTPPTAPASASASASEEIRRALAGVVDPELHASIVELGMVRDVRLDEDGTATVEVALTTAACPLRGQIGDEIRARVANVPGVRDVRVSYAEMTQDQRSAVMQRARFEATQRAPETEVPAATRVLAIASGKGGVGKSSVTVNLAAALATRGLTVGVVDADIWGFSVPRMLGVRERLQGERDERGSGKIVPGRVEVPAADSVGAPGHVEVVSTGLLVEDEDSALMWRGLVLSKALEQFLTDVRWGDLDYLLLDMPPGTGDIQMALSRLLPRAEVLVVTTPARGAQKVAARVADMARRSYLKVAGVVENMSEYVAPDGSRHAVFGSGGGESLAEELGVPLLARIPLDPQVSDEGDEGRPIVLADPESPAAAELHHLADELVTTVLPPVEMAGCTARIFEAAAEKLGTSSASSSLSAPSAPGR